MRGKNKMVLSAGDYTAAAVSLPKIPPLGNPLPPKNNPAKKKK